MITSLLFLIRIFFIHSIFFNLKKCANPSETNWKWGQNLYNLITKDLVDTGLLDKKFIFYDDDGYEPSSKKGLLT